MSDIDTYEIVYGEQLPGEQYDGEHYDGEQYDGEHYDGEQYDGEQIPDNENIRQERTDRYAYLVSTLEELDKVNGSEFVQSVKDKDLDAEKIQVLVQYVSLFKALYNHHTEDITYLNKEIRDCYAENTRIQKKIKTYVNEMSETEVKTANILTTITNYSSTFDIYEIKLAGYSDLIHTYKKNIGQLNLEDQVLRVNAKKDRREIEKLVNENEYIKRVAIVHKKGMKNLKRRIDRYMCLGISCGVVMLCSMVFGKHRL
jgi:chromosome segregation ATPase